MHAHDGTRPIKSARNREEIAPTPPLGWLCISPQQMTTQTLPPAACKCAWEPVQAGGGMHGPTQQYMRAAHAHGPGTCA
eukprot:44801-Chlamydomonas_euryale.AAC.5